MSEVSENKSDLDKVNELIEEIENNISITNNLLKDKLSSPHHYGRKILYIKENIKKINGLQHIDMLKSLNDKVVDIKQQASEINIDAIESNKNRVMDDINILTANIDSTFILFNSYLTIFTKTESEIASYLKSAKDRAKEKINEIDELKNILKDRTTYKIYQQAESKNRFAYFVYLALAIVSAFFGFSWSMYLMKIKTCWMTEYNIDVYDFWTIKITSILVIVTSITFCLKQAIHHQKKKDKAEQTRLELEALPTYMFNFSDEQKNEVYKELTSKYFGRDFNNEGYQDMSNIIQEQIKLSHEVLKTTIANQKNGNQP